jgi:hypothetical protein
VRSTELVPVVRDLLSRCPECFWHEPEELVDVLFSLGYTDDLVDAGEAWAAVEMARADYPQWLPAA